MIYTSCKAACPRIIADMRQIESDLGADAQAVDFTLVSIDPERDTPARLDTFATEQGFDMSRWTLLYGQPADVLELAGVLGVNFRKTTPLDFAHSNIITVLDAKGDIAYQQEGLGVDPSTAIEKIRELVNPGS
jgi:protein SCO1/2